MKPHRWQRKVNERRFQNHTKNQEPPPQLHIPDEALAFPEGIVIDFTPEQADLFRSLLKLERIIVMKSSSVGMSTVIHAGFMGLCQFTVEELEAAYEMAAKGNQNDPD